MTTQREELENIRQDVDDWYDQRARRLEKFDKFIHKFSRKRLPRIPIVSPILDVLATLIGIMALELFVSVTYLVNTFAVFNPALVKGIDVSEAGRLINMVSFISFWVLVAIPGRMFELWKRPISAIPGVYFFYCVFLASVEIVSFGVLGREMAVYMQWVLLAILVMVLLGYRSILKDQKAEDNFTKNLAARLEALKDLPADDPLAETEPEKQQCSICQKESMYEVCLDCEKEYRGERHRVRAQILRAKQHGVLATLTLHQWLGTLNNFHWHCAYCNGDYEVMEHYVPISQGGGTTEDNCVPGCFSCNSKKSDKHPESVRQAPSQTPKQQRKPKKRGN